jgi:hypothetical protein
VEATAEKAVASLVEEWPDRLVMEVDLPDATCWEVLRELSPVDRDLLRVIVMSEGPVSQIRFAEFRPTLALVKPVTPAVLSRVVDETSIDLQAAS